MNKINTDKVSELIGFPINDLGIYQQAFCHKSAIKEIGLELSNERIEFIGDAVLSLIVGTYLFETFPYENEGFLTRLRTKLVSGPNLAKWASEINLNEFVIMNEKAVKNEWFNNPRILEDTFESLIGAIYIDNNKQLDKPKRFLDKFIKSISFEEMTRDTNYKDMLMRFSQSRGLGTPEYKISSDQNSEQKKFCVQVYINGKQLAEGFERNKKMAEQKSALAVLKCLQMV